MNTTTVPSVTDKFLTGCDAIIASAPAFLRPVQEQALAAFEKAGFPTTRHEEWKYTGLNAFTARPVEFSFSSVLTRQEAERFSLLKDNAFVAVLENGILNPSLSKLNGLPQGVIVGELSDYFDHPAVIKHLAKYADHNAEPLVALNTAFIHHGLFIHAGKNVKLEEPIYILSVSTGAHSLSYPRHLIVAENGSDLKIIESVHGNTASFVNAVTEIAIAEKATVELAKIQSEGNEVARIDHTEAILHRDSLFHIHTITAGGRMVRNDLHIVLNDEHANAYLNGLYLADGNMHVDNHTLVDHAKPNCHTNELYKGILNGSSHGVFNGKIMVRKDAQKTNAYQSSKSIILSDDAIMNAKPQLEIYADDVKCSHGATTGRLDEESLFYLRSRGIGIKEAQALLTIAFAEDVLTRISMDKLKERLTLLIHESLEKRIS